MWGNIEGDIGGYVGSYIGVGVRKAKFFFRAPYKRIVTPSLL